MWGMTNSIRNALTAGLLACFAATALSAKDLTIAELKDRLKSTAIGDRPRLCLQIAERQLDAASKSFAADENDNARNSLTESVAFSELARDYAIQSRKHQKQTEIAVRGMTRKLSDLKHTVPHDDQAAVQSAIDRLQRVRDDLLVAMFPHGKTGNQ
jgi:hypothetical protein